MNRDIEVSIIILTWNSGQRVLSCLGSAVGQVPACSTEIILIDNGSSDDTVRMVKEAYPRITLIANPKNYGVAVARNQGIRLAKGKYILFLDDDARISPSSIESLARYLDGDSAAGLVAPMLLGPDGTLQYSCRKYPTLISKVARRMPRKIAKPILEDELLFAWDHATPRQVDYVIGACQLIRRTAIDQVGLLDEKIFYGPEDIDYCIRLAKAGWNIVYDPRCAVIHDEQRITAKSFNKIGFYHFLAMAHFFFKYRYALSRKSLYRSIEIAKENNREQ